MHPHSSSPGLKKKPAAVTGASPTAGPPFAYAQRQAKIGKDHRARCKQTNFGTADRLSGGERLLQRPLIGGDRPRDKRNRRAVLFGNSSLSTATVARQEEKTPGLLLLLLFTPSLSPLEKRAGASRCAGPSPPVRAQRRPSCLEPGGQAGAETSARGRARQPAASAEGSLFQELGYGRPGRAAKEGRRGGAVARRRRRRRRSRCSPSLRASGPAGNSAKFSEGRKAAPLRREKRRAQPSPERGRAGGFPSPRFRGCEGIFPGGKVSGGAGTGTAGQETRVPWRDGSCRNSRPSRRDAKACSPERWRTVPGLSMGAGGVL